MSGPTIDVTARTRIRALAARMHRARIAGVLSLAGGAPSVDESLLNPDQRAEAARIVEEVGSGALKVEEVETASSVAAVIPQYVKPSCTTCHGSGLVRRGSADDLCVCVDRRWQAAVDREAFVAGLRAPDRASGVRVESTRESDAEERVVKAKEALAGAHAAAAAACADLDAAIAKLEQSGAAYFDERGQIDAKRDKAKARAEKHERLASERAKTVAEARDRVEDVALQIGELIQPLFQVHKTRSVDDDRAKVHALVDEVYAAAAAADAAGAQQTSAEASARRARADEKALEQRIVALDAEYAPLTGEIERLRTERARIARHHQPKIERAEKRLKRLVYLSGGDRDADGAPAATQGSEGK